MHTSASTPQHDPVDTRKAQSTRLSSISKLSPPRSPASTSLDFMQPEPSNDSQTALNPQASPEHPATTPQHGLQDVDQQLSLLPHHSGEQGESAPPGATEQRALHNPSGGSGVDGPARLRSTSPSPVPKDRITEYENALTKTPKKKRHMGPMFEVIRSTRSPDDKSCPISSLPNEILTHVLSHLSPHDLTAVSLVSKRFTSLVTTPHAWREAFIRYFPGAAALMPEDVRLAMEDAADRLRSEKRAFTRLSALPSWRSEYILRTRLLRSLVRGKPAQVLSPTAARSGQVQTNVAANMYSASTFTIINHLHATFGSGLNKRVPRLVHGADDVGQCTSSDPTIPKVDPWGQIDQTYYAQFTDRFPGVPQWGLEPGELVGRPNLMDVSQPHGMLYGQGCPDGTCYYRAPDEQRGRVIAETTGFSMPEAGVPRLSLGGGAICSVWIAKTNTIPKLSDGMVGILVGSAAGVLTACSFGTDGIRGPRYQRGELMARWVLSPGVPIIAIAVDEDYSLKRQAQNRIWAVALNALGELFYLTKFPTRSQAPKGQLDENYSEYLAWLTGRSVYWNLVEPSRRIARRRPWEIENMDGKPDGSYSPTSSWDGMCLSQEQIRSETNEIQKFISKKPKDFHRACLGWDMRRRLEVDFAGDDGHYAGEAMVVVECGLEAGDTAKVTRYSRWKTRENAKDSTPSTPTVSQQASQTTFILDESDTSIPDLSRQRTRYHTRSSSCVSENSSTEGASLVEEWRVSYLAFSDLRSVQVTITALDSSTFATITTSEDPALGFSTASTASSPYASPMSATSQPSSPSDVPGQRARFVAVGTKTGDVLLWNVRSPVSRKAEFPNTINPIRIIHTLSPEISCIALTALQVVVGGFDGLVQVWDPLASDTKPVRTIHSRHSMRARRRLLQAQGSILGVGVNMYAAGAIVLDPDPTVLRGAVSVGNMIRYWSYSSSAADQYKSSKRRIRRSERGSNNAGERGVHTRSSWQRYLEKEEEEVKMEILRDRERAKLWSGRFGTDLLGNEEEAMAYATMLSQESMPMGRQPSSPKMAADTELDPDIAEAMRLSLEDSSASGIYETDSSPPHDGWNFQVKYAKPKKSPPRSKKGSPTQSGKAGGWNKEMEMSDLELALQLSLAEETRRKGFGDDDFPPLAGWKGKGKAI